jgi:murein DD-endopeptidase MepM/ murein hydrolase activator NlpD
MQEILHHSRRWRLALVMVAGGMTAACSTYHPLGHGSKVPWARAGVVSGPAAAASPASAETAPAAVSLPADRYVVRRGDRLGDLAGDFGVSMRALAKANRLEPPYPIYVGQVLRVPKGSQAVERADLQAAPTVQVVELEDARVADVAPAAGPVIGTPESATDKRYVVRRGETLWSISKRLDVPLDRLAAANDISAPYEIVAGDRLRIPGLESAATDGTTPQTVAAHPHGTEPPALTGRGFIWPVNGKVIASFGRTQQGQRRNGIDIAAREGAPVLAAEDGLVAYAGEGIHGYGRLILLRHGEGYITAYGYNAALLVEVGELVQRGQVIARVGSTGNATRSMLHFELRKGRKPIDPQSVLVREPTAVASTE